MAGGLIPVVLEKSVSWEDFFVRYVRYLFRAQEIAQGPRTPEIERLVNLLFNRLIPQLLRPLETGGREITPTLLHTNLWDGNLLVSYMTELEHRYLDSYEEWATSRDESAYPPKVDSGLRWPC
ncbi:uncharacterized protein PG998_010346 [Apiospora kogelbergensis]|uniref:uncharacterized protein n=1 Tax=Apiospora kogelbergensis TaxID=1337665 RepID=UPI00312D11A3